MNHEEKSYASLIIKTEGEMEMSLSEALSLFGQGGASITSTLSRDNTPVKTERFATGSEYTYLQVVPFYGVSLLQRRIVGNLTTLATVTTWFSVDVGSAEYEVIETQSYAEGQRINTITYAGIVSDSEMLDERGHMGSADVMIRMLWEDANR